MTCIAEPMGVVLLLLMILVNRMMVLILLMKTLESNMIMIMNMLIYLDFCAYIVTYTQCNCSKFDQ